MVPKPNNGKPLPVNLKRLAEYLELSPTTVSLILNDAPSAKSLSASTRERVRAAARELDYRPNISARSLRTRQSFSVGVIVPEVSEGYFTGVMAGVEAQLLQSGYMYLTVSHLCRPELMEKYLRMLLQRSVDGFLLVNTVLREALDRPVVSISYAQEGPGVTSITLDHERAAVLALRHLQELGHERIAFMKGQAESHDAEPRWQAIQKVAAELGIAVHPELCVYIEENLWTPQLGYPGVSRLLGQRRDFSAIFCFNDLAAIGAMRAVADAGLRCPQDISVVGFDDISTAAYVTPSLTTISQPLRRMGELAAEQLLSRIERPEESHLELLTVAPELVVRESTGAAPGALRRSRAQAG